MKSKKRGLKLNFEKTLIKTCKLNSFICILQLNYKINNENLEKGESEIRLDASDLSDGIYFYAIIADDKVIHTKTMIRLK